MVIYRSATFDDVEKLHKLLNDYAAEGLMLPRSRNSIYENLRDYVVAVENNHVIGCGALHFVWDRLAEIRSLAVDPERKTQGIGRKMVELLEAEGIERGVKMFFISRDFLQNVIISKRRKKSSRRRFGKNVYIARNIRIATNWPLSKRPLIMNQAT